MQTANEKQPDAVEQCNLDCSPQACGRCTCQPAPHTTCEKQSKPSVCPEETSMTYGTKPVSKLKDEIWEALHQQWKAGAQGLQPYDPESALDLIGVADAIGNHLVKTIFKGNEEYQIIE